MAELCDHCGHSLPNSVPCYYCNHCGEPTAVGRSRTTLISGQKLTERIREVMRETREQ